MTQYFLACFFATAVAHFNGCLPEETSISNLNRKIDKIRVNILLFLRLCCFFHLLHMKKSDFWVCDEKKNNRDQTPSFVVPWPIKALLDLLKRSALVPCAGLFQPIPVCREQPSIIMSTDNKEFETAAPKHSHPLLSRMQVDEDQSLKK